MEIDLAFIGMFELLNIITDVLITEPKKIDNYFENLPDPQKDAVEKRDSKSTKWWNTKTEVKDSTAIFI